MPSYFPRPDKQIFAPPYLIPHALLGGAVFNGQHLSGSESLQTEFVDPILNGAQAGRFDMPLGDLGIAVFAHYPDVHSGAPSPDGAWGRFNYHEATIVLPVRDTDTGSNYWFFPVMMLDSFLPIVSGREVLGFPKVLGRIEWDWASGVWNSSVDVEGFALKTPSETASWHRVMEGALSTLLVSFKMNSHPSKFRDFVESLKPPDSADRQQWALVTQFLSATFAVKAVFLKQLPQCADTAQTDYQDLVVCDCKLTAIHGLGMGLGSVTFQAPESFPLATRVGHTLGSATASLAFGVEMDWEFGPGTVLP